MHARRRSARWAARAAVIGFVTAILAAIIGTSVAFAGDRMHTDGAIWNMPAPAAGSLPR
jgi:hypothetical protein